MRTRRLLVSLCAASAFLLSAADAAAQSKTLRFVPQSDLRVLDPIWTTDYVARNHGYMVFDTLFAMDESFKIQPQMVDRWSVSPDGLAYTFTLRDGLTFHDGQPVRSADCIASLDRWSKRDAFGAMTAEKIAGMEAVDDKTFVIKLRVPYPLLLDSLGKLSSNVPFIMPEHLAKTDPMKQVTDVVGSGPFIFVREEWVQGSKVVYRKNPAYVPRKEPASWAAGGKVVKVDRVEWHIMPDPAIVAAALAAGEIDYWEQVPIDLVPLLQKNASLSVANAPLGNLGLLRFNHALPPFNSPKMREAVLHLVDQSDYMAAVAGDTKNWSPCYSFFTCGTPLASEDGADPQKGPRDIAKAKKLIAEAGYKNEKIVIISATDQPTSHAQSMVTADILRKAGLNVELQAMDWGTLVTRRASRETVERGGWSIFHTKFVGPDMVSPATNNPVRGNGDKGWPGWANDPALEELRTAWFSATDMEGQKKIAAAFQKRAYESLPYVPTGAFIQPIAYRKNVSGVIVAPIAFLWNIDKM